MSVMFVMFVMSVSHSKEVCSFEVPPPMAADGLGDAVAWSA
jgi:hypothetical protein